MAKIRHEINMLCGTMVQTSTTTNIGSNETIVFNPTAFSGQLTVYLEAVYTNTSTASAILRISSSSYTTTLNANTTSFAVSRAEISLSSYNALVKLQLDSLSAAGTVTVKAARLVIIQDTGSNPITASESQFEIGNRETLTMAGSATYPTNAVALSAPKYWTYEADKWDGTCAFAAEVVASTSGTMGYTFTCWLQEDDGNFGTWTDKVQVASAAPNTTVTRYRSSAFTPTNGRHYRLRVHLNNTMESLNIYCGKILVTQQSSPAENKNMAGSGYSAIYGDGNPTGPLQKVGQSIVGRSAASFTKVRLYGRKAGSPTDSIYCELRNTSPSGSLIAISNNTALSGVSTSDGWVEFTFSSPQSLTDGSSYGLVFRRTLNGADGTNTFEPKISTANAYTDGTLWYFDSIGWNQNTTTDFIFEIVPETGITELQEQYLLGNTLLSAGTTAQNFLTKVDATELSGVTTNFTHVVDASDNNTSIVELCTTGGTQVVGSVVTTPDNHEASSAITPTNVEIFDVRATTNSGSVYASRIIADVVVNTKVTTIKHDNISVTVDYS